MGLGVNQARLIFCTSRKADVENAITKIAHQKLSLSREVAAAAKEYSRAQNAKKYTVATDRGNVDLTYDLLMRPNTTADRGQYLLTNTSTGRVILDNRYLSSLGIGPSGNPRDIANFSYTVDGITYTGERAFVMKMMGCSAKDAKDYSEIIEYNDRKIIRDSIGSSEYGSETTLLSYFKSYPLHWDNNDSAQTVNNFLSLMDAYSSSIEEAFKEALYTPANPELGNIITNAANYAKNATIAKFINNQVDESSLDGASYSTNFVQPGKEAPDCTDTNLVNTWGYGGAVVGQPQYFQATVDNSQIVDTYFTFFDKYMAEHTKYNELAGGFSINEVNRDLPTTIRDKYKLVSEVDSRGYDVNNNNMNDPYEGYFYVNLYNAILQFGWETDNNINDKKYLNTQLQYGNINLYERHGRKWETLSTSSYECPLELENDEDAIEKAKIEYENVREQTNLKESTLDVEMTNLDAERAALTTTIESIQSFIKKNVEIFKLFA